MSSIPVQMLKSAIDELFEETFEKHHGIYTYKGTSILETISSIDATQASHITGVDSPSIAAQVAHTTFYLEVLESVLLNEDVSDTDWEHIWATVQTVTPEEWTRLQQELRETYERLREMLMAMEHWGNPETISPAMAVIVHSAYHLGVIRQAIRSLPTTEPTNKSTG